MEMELACVYLNTTREQLSCLNGVKARLYMPVTVFLGLLIVIGTLGNTTVCLVYCRRKIRVSSHYFIVSLAILDLITCVIGMPTEMADLILPLTFDSPIACKVLRFVHSSTIIASSTILIEVAFDRYFRICHLGRHFTANKARMLCLGALLLGVVFSWPSCVIFGKKTVAIFIQGHIIEGTDCSTDDSMRGTIYPTIYYLFLFSLFGFTLAFFTVLYSKIGLRIVTQNRMRAGGGGGGGGGAGSSEGAEGSDEGTPQEKLAEVLRSGINREVETPSSDLPSDPGSGSPSSLRNSSTSGSSHTSGLSVLSGSSRSSGSSGTSCGSARPLVEPSSPNPFLRDVSTPADVSSGINKNSYNNITAKYSSSHAQRKSGSFLDRLQVPKTIPETSRVKLLANNLQPIQVYSYKNRSTEMLNGDGACNDAPGMIQPDNGTNDNEQGINDMDRSTDTLPKELLRQKKVKKSTRKPFSTRGLSCCCGCERNDQFDYRSKSKTGTQNHDESSNQNVFDDSTLPRKRKGQSSVMPTHRTCNRQLRVGKTTTVLFAVTLAYILSFLPYLTVMVMRSVVKDLEESLSPMGELAYKLCVKSFFINNAINPIIYSFLNHSFRKDASRMLGRLCKRGTTSSRSNPAASI